MNVVSLFKHVNRLWVRLLIDRIFLFMTNWEIFKCETLYTPPFIYVGNSSFSCSQISSAMLSCLASWTSPSSNIDVQCSVSGLCYRRVGRWDSPAVSQVLVQSVDLLLLGLHDFQPALLVSTPEWTDCDDLKGGDNPCIEWRIILIIL